MTVYDFERLLSLTKGQMVIYENTELETLRTFRYKETQIVESDPVGKRRVKEILWGEKHMIVTVEEEATNG